MIWLLLLVSTSFSQERFRPSYRDENSYQLLLEMRKGTPVLTSSPTYIGKPTFSNGIVFGDGTEQTTAAGNCIAGSETFLSSNSFSAVGGSTITIAAGSKYRIFWNLIKTTAGDVAIRFNSDTGNNYAWAYRGYLPGSGAVDVSATGAGQIYGYDGTNHDIGDGEYYRGELLAETDPTDGTLILVTGATNDSSGSHYGGNFIARYDGASSVSSISLVSQTGTITGYIHAIEVCQ